MAADNERVIAEFRLWYPTFYERTVEHVAVGYHSLLAVLDDGTKLEFSSLDNTIKDVTRTYDPEFNNNMTDDEYRNEFASRLKSVMRDRSIKQEQLADTIDVSRQIMSRYVNGKAVPKTPVIRRIARALDCDVRYLIDFDYILRK